MLHTSDRRWPSLIICSSASIQRVVSCAKYIENAHVTFLLSPSLFRFRRVPTMLPASHIELQCWSLSAQAIELTSSYEERPSRRSEHLPFFLGPTGFIAAGKKEKGIASAGFFFRRISTWDLRKVQRHSSFPSFILVKRDGNLHTAQHLIR